MDIAEQLKLIEAKITGYLKEGKKIFTSSSFQTHSIPLLHILVNIDSDIPVYFLNTGYHFPETILFRDRIAAQLGLRLIDLKPETPKSMQKGSDGKFLFTSDPDHCCYINKTRPMDKILMEHDVWINGVRADQSDVRKNMQEEMPAPHNTTRYHPMLPWTSKMIYEYRKRYDLPEHPLDAMGYMSIGCEPCTRRFDPEMQEREVRWYGLKKTECGLHTDLITNKN